MTITLELVDLVDSGGKPIDGLVPVNQPASAKSPHERAILLQARTFHHIDHVLFRRFENEEGVHLRSSQVAAYIVDNTQGHRSEDELALLHHQLWLQGVAPLIYVAWPTRIDILSCARQPDFWEDGVARYRQAERIEAPTVELPSPEIGPQMIQTAAVIADELARRLSAYRLTEGTFWDDPKNQTLAKEDAAAHRSLIRAIVQADVDLEGVKYPVRRRLLILMVMIKYLEDRHVIPEGHFAVFHPEAASFRDILRKGTVEEVLSLLRDFEDKFNGDVFTLGEDSGNLTEAELGTFATLVAADVLGDQRHFWELYSFEHIPVEVISRLYQRFVTGHGAIYTPPFLASLLLDQVMPYDQMTGREKVLDPACGSGIFLVGAFKRLVVHWRDRNHWRMPAADDLNRILSHSIFGVELESNAVDLTAFSLALAVCDALEPPAVIWDSLKFTKARGKNLREGDFFDPATFLTAGDCEWPAKFDIVIGNPPFGSELTASAKAIEAGRPKKQPKLPDKQVAYLFLEQGLRLLVPGGSLCLIQPHGLLYNSNPIKFRQHLMGLGRLHAVLDFVSVRGLYDGADTKSVAWHAINAPVENQAVNHLTFRRTYSTSEQITFEIDHYDWHLVSQDWLIRDQMVWRVGLLGGGRIHDLSFRLNNMATLDKAIVAKGWICCEGFNVGNRRTSCDYLTGQPYLPTEALTENHIDASRIKDLTEDKFESPRVKELYQPPLILIKEHISLPVAFWNSSNLTYRHTIVGIHAPSAQERELQEMFHQIEKHRRLYRLCILLNGTRVLTGRATAINKQDIDRLPYPTDLSELDLAFWEEALKDDIVDHMADYVRLGQKSNLLKNAADASDLRRYSSLYVQMLGTLYGNLHAHAPVFLNGLIAQPFYFGLRPDVSWLGENCEKALHRLIYDNSRGSLRTVRVVRYYQANVILIVKPDRLRYWIRSTAIRDADDTLTDLREQGW